MLTTKGQKFWMAFFAVIALLLGLVVLVPFKSISEADNIFTIEMLVKLVAIPVIILLISIFPNKLKYIQVKGYREQSRIVSIISYFPAVVYLCALIGESIYLLAQGYVLNGSAPLGTIPWNLWYVALIVDLVLLMIALHIFPKYEMQLDVKEHIILDICVFVLLVCFGLMYLLVSRGTNDAFVAAGANADPLLLTTYIIGLIVFVAELYFVAATIRRDEVNVNIRLNDLDAKSFVAKAAEYNRAYNDIMDHFEDYFVEDGELDIQEVEMVGEGEDLPEEENEEAVEGGVAAPAEEAEEEAPAEEAEEAQEEAPAEEAEQAQEEAPQEAPAEEQDQPAEEAQEPVQNEELAAKQEEVAALEAEVEALRQQKEKEAQEAAEAEAAKIAAKEEAARIAEEKALKNKEEMQPTFAKLVKHAKGLEGVSCIEDSEKRQARFLIGKKVFLIMTDTDKDYRLQFVNDPIKVVNWWNENSEIRPRSNKVDNWFKLTNKGSFTEELLFTIIDSSRDFMASEQERIAAEKKAERAAAKAAAKQALEEQKKAEAEAEK